MKVIGRICYTVRQEYDVNDYLKTTDEVAGIYASVFGLTVHREIYEGGFVGVDGISRSGHKHLVYEFSAHESRPYYKKALQALADHYFREQYYFDTQFEPYPYKVKYF